jgi:hypothetical protein
VTLLWLLVWGLASLGDPGAPHLHQWNGWAVTLLAAVALDLADHRS